MYDMREHRHRFAVWAAARAAQRGFANVDSLRMALERSGIAEFVAESDPNDIDADRFDELHGTWCRPIVRQLRRIGLSKASYGRAAKLVAIYLKAAVILGPDGRSKLAHVAHPPIDSILLRNIGTAYPSEYARDVRWTKYKWTTLSEGEYWELIGHLRRTHPADRPFWQLEQYWNVSAKAVV
jgi:hypothetical protein